MTTTEAEFQRAVLDLAHLCGFTVAHFRGVKVATRNGIRHMTPVAADGKGFPDLVLVKDRVLFRELKTDRGRLSEAQHEWMAVLEGAGADVDVWRPSDWARIERTLTGKG